MKELIVNGETFISTKRAAEITGYTTDYVGQLARGGKVVAQLVGRNWYVEEESIKKHKFGSMSDSVQMVDDVPSAPELEVLIEEKEEMIEEIPEVKETPVVKKESNFVSNTLDEMQNAWNAWYSVHEVKDDHNGVVLSTEEIQSLKEDTEENVPVYVEEEISIKREDVASVLDKSGDITVEDETVHTEEVLSPYQDVVRANDKSSLFVGTLSLLLLVGLIVAGGFVVYRNDISTPASVISGVEQYLLGVTEFQR